ncbi:MAG: RagB/SusD family nutrient uptake outer membrane protein, partial [Bacteroidetes bacterium]|nr:RagB/SusD family nutrient uptake outer membrane protein [Bacteroidota bacterium]
MKNLLYKFLTKSVFAFILLIFLQSCDSEFLEKKPLGQLTSDNFFETEQHAIWATNAVYNHMRSWEVHVFSYIALTDIVSDDADKGSTPNYANFLNEIDNFTFDPGNITFSTVWGGYYKGIFRANLAIQNIPDIDMDQSLKDQLIAENKFLRAYFYFKLVRWFRDLPLITRPLTSDEYKQERVSADQVYDLIEQDLLDAIENLPERSQYHSSDLGRATKGAARGMLAKVYLTRNDFENAEKYAREVINSGQYQLLPNYSKIFTREGENSLESLFEVQSVALETGGGSSQFNEVQGVRGTPNLGWGFNRPSDNLVSSYEPGDPR